MDQIDAAIIKQLQLDARIPNVELAERVGLTPGPCLRRVQRLETSGVILGYQAQVSPQALQQGFVVFLDINIKYFDKDSIEEFEASLTAFDEVLELHRMFGTPDYLVRVAVADLAAYEHFHTHQLLTIPGIDRVASRFPLKAVASLRPNPDLAK